MRAVLCGVKKAPRRRKKKICEEGSPDDVVVVHLFEQADLADRGTRHALILGFESNLFQRDNLVRLFVPGAVLFSGQKGKGPKQGCGCSASVSRGRW